MGTTSSTSSSSSGSTTGTTASKSVKFVDRPTVHYPSKGYWDFLDDEEYGPDFIAWMSVTRDDEYESDSDDDGESDTGREEQVQVTQLSKSSSELVDLATASIGDIDDEFDLGGEGEYEIGVQDRQCASHSRNVAGSIDLKMAGNHVSAGHSQRDSDNGHQKATSQGNSPSRPGNQDKSLPGHKVESSVSSSRSNSTFTSVFSSTTSASNSSSPTSVPSSDDNMVANGRDFTSITSTNNVVAAAATKGLKRLISLTRRASPSSGRRRPPAAAEEDIPPLPPIPSAILSSLPSFNPNSQATPPPRPQISGPFALGTVNASPLRQRPNGDVKKAAANQHHPATLSPSLDLLHVRTDATRSTVTLASKQEAGRANLSTRSRAHRRPPISASRFQHVDFQNRTQRNLPSSSSAITFPLPAINFGQGEDTNSSESSIPPSHPPPTASSKHLKGNYLTVDDDVDEHLKAMPSLESFRSGMSAGGRSIKSLGSLKSTASTRMFRSWLGKTGGATDREKNPNGIDGEAKVMERGRTTRRIKGT